MPCSSHKPEAGWSAYDRSLRNLIMGLLIIGLWGGRRTKAEDCELCIHIKKEGQKVTTTLLFYSFYECKGTHKGTCTYNQIQYSICDPGHDHPYICYNPRDPPTEVVFELKVTKGGGSWGWKDGLTIAQTRVKGKPEQVILRFDACAALSHSRWGCGSLAWERSYSIEHKYICRVGSYCEVSCPYWSCVQWSTWEKNTSKKKDVYFKRGISLSNCTTKGCNPLELIITNPLNPRWKAGEVLSLGIDGKGRDPIAPIVIRGQVLNYPAQAFHIYKSFYKEATEPLPLPPQSTKNLFLKMAEGIAHSLNVTSCYVCGGTLMGDKWPWEAKELVPTEALPNITAPRVSDDSQWILKHTIVGQYCLARGGGHLTESVGDLTCLGQRYYNATSQQSMWWGNQTEKNPLARFPELAAAWKDPGKARDWIAPRGLYWICGNKAYIRLPRNWKGSCVIGMIKPSFFLLPLKTGELLSYPASQPLHRVKRELQTGDWKDNEWPPERVIQHYGPATWALHGSWGYCTPISMLNRIIRLQAVFEVITNETGRALTLLAHQQTQMRNAIYQNRLALDYLLAAQGGVCGKFNLTNCCLKIDDQGQVVEDLVTNMTKPAHVPVQVWNGWEPSSLFGGWFSAFGGFKTLIGVVLLLLGICLVGSCVLPLLINSLRSTVEARVQQRTPAYYTFPSTTRKSSKFRPEMRDSSIKSNF
ncbi:endogenous retrovirus group 3 member 1 Env polyprotein isoform X2 [Saccopteryx bilineata]|uniref:endogenous retrovirus group 3 member 1 Env polyprotein isoform X2 n=1 Tax=Saccopteryx bilineata TaxID=59482 RepID=UPI00338EA971